MQSMALLADKQALQTQLRSKMLAIRGRELNYYCQNCFAVSTQASLIAGFSYAALTQVAIPPESPYIAKLVYLFVTTTAMCLELVAVAITTLLSLLGPGLAIRGPDGSVHHAVDGMVDQEHLDRVILASIVDFSATKLGLYMRC